jgi:hypothetical protein
MQIMGIRLALIWEISNSGSGGTLVGKRGGEGVRSFLAVPREELGNFRSSALEKKKKKKLAEIART